MPQQGLKAPARAPGAGMAPGEGWNRPQDDTGRKVAPAVGWHHPQDGTGRRMAPGVCPPGPVLMPQPHAGMPGGRARVFIQKPEPELYRIIFV